MSHKFNLIVTAALCVGFAQGQSQNAPSVSQVLMYSATMPNLTVPTSTGVGGTTLPRSVASIFTETATTANLGDATASAINNAANYSISRNIVQLNNALNASIATALSIIPLSSPASGVIVRKDPATGAELPVSSTLGPIFTERAETIGKGNFYVGFSNQDFHFTKFNGTSLNSLSILYTGGDPSKVVLGSPLSTVPATFGLGLDVRLSQDIAFFTYGVTDRVDVSLGLPVIHAAVSGRMYNGMIYAGNGVGTNGSTCWCANTFTPGFPTLIQPQIGSASQGKTGLGDVLVRVKATVYRSSTAVVAVGGDLRLPTGDEANYLGVGTTTVKPFTAVSFYTKPLRNNIVLSPHFDVGWQFSGKSTLGGELQGTPMTQSTATGNINYVAAPFFSTKGYLPDVFSWAAGTELAFGRHNTFIADILGNQVGWIHGIPNATMQTISNVLLPTGPNGDGSGAAVPVKGSASGLVSAGRVSFGQYSASLGYKARINQNLVANFNVVLRLDNNGLVARAVPMVGLGYSF
ncbi:MAG TPA: hypothetical protein VKU19_14295 [Bryobacteraceae bacterium]|nr:hypothetical protein [Bryobacteraceae bacterium]